MNILLIRLRLVGDVVFTTPAVRALRRRYPEARLTYLVERAAAPIVLGNPHIDDVLVVPHARGWRRIADDLRLARALRARRFDLVIDFHGGPRSSWLAWATGAPQRIGYTVAGRGWMYTNRVERPRELRRRHSVENQWDLLAPLGVPPLAPETDPVEMLESADAARRVDGRLRETGVEPDAALIVLHVSAGNPFRRWPAESFAGLAAGLVRSSPGRVVVLTAGPSDRRAAGAVAEMAHSQLRDADRPRVVLGDDLDLSELKALVARAALYIGGDSGPLHLAATCDTPIVGLYGPTLPERSAPWRPGHLVHEAVDAGALPCRPCDQRQCAPGDFRCLSGIDADVVLAAAERALGRARDGRGAGANWPSALENATVH